MNQPTQLNKHMTKEISDMKFWHPKQKNSVSETTRTVSVSQVKFMI